MCASKQPAANFIFSVNVCIEHKQIERERERELCVEVEMAFGTKQLLYNNY